LDTRPRLNVVKVIEPCSKDIRLANFNHSESVAIRLHIVKAELLNPTIIKTIVVRPRLFLSRKYPLASATGIDSSFRRISQAHHYPGELTIHRTLLPSPNKKRHPKM
jgi:hypothetical protein